VPSLAVTFICALALILPPDPESLRLYHLNAFSFRLIILLLLLPFVLIWYAAFYAFAKMSEYTRYIKTSKEENAFRKVSIGLGVLAFGFVVPSIISTILNEIASYHHGFKAAAAITNHYIALLVPLLSFTFLGTGARMLSSSVDIKASLNSSRLFGLIFIILCVVFTRSTVTTHHYGGNPYYLSIYTLVITLVIPYLYSWFIGLVSAFDIWL
jgi:hypothetical protein